MTPTGSTRRRLAVFLLACASACAIGAIDVFTGADIVVTSLYFLPLAMAGMRLPRAAAMAVAAFTTAVWLTALMLDHGLASRRVLIWVINFVTQGSAFLIVTLLISRLGRQLGLEQRLRRSDTLTGLLNRQGFLEQASAVLTLCRRHRRPVALAYLDLDDFKRANDTAGHDHGDRLLQACGALISSAVRASDIAARIGGDEFVILLPETEPAAALDVCQRIAWALRAHADFSASGVGVSVGVVTDATASLDVEALLKRADMQMYGAKHAGKGEVQVCAAGT